MDITEAGQALYIACEMERRAIRLYERALLLFDDAACREAVAAMLKEERRHLMQFEAMGAQTPGFERGQALSAQAAQVIFSGGLVEAQRKGAFASAQALFRYAAGEEEAAVKRYGAFAACLTGEAAAAFSAIAEQEKHHLVWLQEQLNQK